MEATATSQKPQSSKNGRPYLLVFGILAVLTIVEVAVGMWDIDKAVQVPALAVLALGKAYLVAAFFIGIKYEAHPFLVATIVFLLPLSITLPVAVAPIFD
ncbi:MAG: cytochrome C oxidase subunit IV family protein [Candidatus Hodarchaeales archaeon]|jgi:cytochrome c oxidase subunit IV